MSGSRIAVFTGARSDLGPLGPVIAALDQDPGLDLTILAAVSQSEEAVRHELHRLGVEDIMVEMLGGAPPSDAPQEIIRCGSDLQAVTSATLTRLSARSLVVLGDRWELLYVVPPAVLLRIPVVHLHGGEVTEGALDERVRHAVTKLADQHCVATEEAARRLRQMGEPDSRVYVTGAPGLDRLAGADPFTPAEFEELFGLELHRPVALVTYHAPTTASNSRIGEWADAVLEESASAASTVIVTAPGLDPGQAAVARAIRNGAQRHPHVAAVKNLGTLYPRALATADVMVGNSSSGIIEAASFGLPVLDVGERQKGRVRGRNVMSVDEGAAAVRTGLRTVLDPSFRRSLGELRNPYGDGHAADRIVRIVVQSANAPASAKTFHDCSDHTR